VGSILIKLQGESRDSSQSRKAADPSVQTAIRVSSERLDFAGHPPVRMSHGLLATYEISFATFNAEKSLKRFKGDAIAGFDGMGPAERRAAIKDFIVWLNAEQDHVDFVENMAAAGGGARQGCGCPCGRSPRAPRWRLARLSRSCALRFRTPSRSTRNTREDKQPMATIADLEELQDGISASIQTLLQAYNQCGPIPWPKARRS